MMAKPMGSQQEDIKKVPLHLVIVIIHLGTTKDHTTVDHAPLRIVKDLMTMTTKYLVMADIPAVHTIKATMMNRTPGVVHNS